MNLTKIYRDEKLAPSVFVVDWMLHDRCTYDCSYCPPSNKKGTDDWLDLNRIDDFCNRLEEHVAKSMPGSKICALFTGGEPTVWKGFDQLIDNLKSRGWLMNISSNGSRSLRWWEEHASYFERISLSYHSEGVVDDQFIEKIKVCSKDSDLVVNMMMNPNVAMFQKAVAFSERMEKEIPDFYFSVEYVKIQYNFGLQEIKVVPYSIEQLDELTNLQNNNPRLKRIIELHQSGKISQIKNRAAPDNFMIEFDNGQTEKLMPGNLINKNLANFNEWSCAVGLESIFIDAKGDILRGTCRVGGKLGNINDPSNIKWPKDNIICNLNWCGCITDIMNSKENLRLTVS